MVLEEKLMKKRSLVLMVMAIAISSMVFASGTSEDAKQSTSKSSGKVTIRYVLWDANQLPAYQKVAESFMAKNPNIQIKIEQLGWGDYWTALQTDMVSGTAPDVFTNHLAKYPDFSSKKQLVDIAPLVKRDNVDTSIYMNGLAGLWATKDGKRYGLPKDWDTIAIVYNAEMLKAAGISEKEANELTWNPNDGGTFEKFIAKLSIDKNGKNGLDPSFDATNVVQYGIALNHSDDRGQAQFSPLAVSTGWMYTDGLYNANFHFDDPRFIKTIEWMVRVTKKGYMASYEETVNGANSLFTSKKAATVFDGSWMIGYYTSSSPFKVGFAKLPVGPVGRRSMINGLADSIWVGTKHPEEAWQWVKYLASEEAQKIVGSYGVVFPAIKAGVDEALKAYTSKNINVTTFTDEANEKNGTFVYPVVENGVKISEIMTQTFDAIFIGKVTPEAGLKDANKKILDLFK